MLGYHPILATRAGTGEILHARLRKGSAHTARGARRFIEELVARVRRAGAACEMVLRVDSGYSSIGAPFSDDPVADPVAGGSHPCTTPVGRAPPVTLDRLSGRVDGG